jgi:3-methylfumaryl-CoA hydratase
MQFRSAGKLSSWTAATLKLPPIIYRSPIPLHHSIALNNSLPSPFKSFHLTLSSTIPKPWETTVLPETVFYSTDELGSDGTEEASLISSRPPRIEGKGEWERMWVGGEVIYSDEHNVFKVEEETTVELTVDKIDWKVGKDGREGCYVTTKRTLSQVSTGATSTELRTHLYRLPLRSYSSEPPLPVMSQQRMTIPSTTPLIDYTVTSIHLFRFSALTFNSHLIHLSPLYTQESNLPGLLVHAPLTSILLAMALIKNSGKNLKTWKYRATNPLAVGKQIGIWIIDNNMIQAWDLNDQKLVMRGDGQFW